MRNSKRHSKKRTNVDVRLRDFLKYCEDYYARHDLAGLRPIDVEFPIDETKYRIVGKIHDSIILEEIKS